MIDLGSKIKQDLSSSINNFDLLVHINSSGQDYYLGTQPITLDGNYYDDVIAKIGGAKESIDLRSKKLKLSGTSITINNAEINGKRFSDKVQGEMFGGVVDIYIKTQSCETLDDCKIISSLQISGVTHDSSSIILKCEDKYIDEFHKELPLIENTLYEGVDTFTGDNERRIPILYGHLKKAPAVVYIRNNESESPFTDNNILIAPDKAFKDDSGYDIIGIKQLSPFVLESTFGGSMNQLVKQDVLSIKLGDFAANVYSNPPDRLHKELVSGNQQADLEYRTDWITQFSVSDDRSFINLFTESHADASNNLASGNLFCGEVSKLIGAKTHKVKVYRADSSLFDLSWNIHDIHLSTPHYTGLTTDLASTSPNPQNFDMLSLPAFYLNDTDVATNYTTGMSDGLKIGINQENYILQILYDIGDHNIEFGAHLSFDIPTFELEFEPLKASASLSKGNKEALTDANLISSFRHHEKTISDTGNLIDEGKLEYMQYCFYPAQGNQTTDEQVNVDFFTSDGLDLVEHPDSPLVCSKNVLGVPSYAYGGYNLSFWGSAYNLSDWYNEYVNTEDDEYNLTLRTFTNHLREAAAIRGTAHIAWSVNGSIKDYRHTFHTALQNDFGHHNNTWRVWHKFAERTNWLSQNIYTGLAFPAFKAGVDWDGYNQRCELAINTTFNGMYLKRSWYQKEVFNENFFVNAKGKYTQMANVELLDGYNRIMYGENLSISFLSDEVDAPSSGDYRSKNDHVLFQLMDYLTKDRFKKYYEDGKEYELIISGEIDDTSPPTDNSKEIIFFDFDVNDFRATPAVYITKYLYQFYFNSKIFRPEMSSVATEYMHYWDYENNTGAPFYVGNIKLEYAYRNLDPVTGVIDSFTKLDDAEVGATGTPFTILNDEDEIVNRQKITFGNEGAGASEDNANSAVFMYISTQSYLECPEPHTPVVIHTDSSYLKELITKPSDVVQDVASRELGLSSDIIKKDVSDNRYKLDFSIDKTEEGIDVMQKIAQSSPFFYKNQLSTGKPSIVGTKPFYDKTDVDKAINVNQILKYKFTKTKKEDVALKCIVKYGYDYVSEEYTKTTGAGVEESMTSHDAETKAMYIDYYDIKDEETYTLEHEAPYIQDKASAEMLAKHLFEIHKNQHLNISFQVPLGDSVELEVGDILSFVDNNGLRTNINNTKPFGVDMRSVSFLPKPDGEFVRQAVFPYFMITSIKKDLTKSDILVTQLHELAPSLYDSWSPVDWSQYVFDPDTGDYIIPPPANNPPSVQILTATGVDTFSSDLSANLAYSASDGDGELIGYMYQITYTDTGEVLEGQSFQDNLVVFESPVNDLALSVIDLGTMPDYGNYTFHLRVYDDDSAFAEDTISAVFMMYEEQDPVGIVRYQGGLDDVTITDDNGETHTWDVGQQIAGENIDFGGSDGELVFDSDTFYLPYREGGYNIMFSAADSYSLIPEPYDTSLSYLWSVWNTEDGQMPEGTGAQYIIQMQSVGVEWEVALAVTDVDNNQAGVTGMHFEMLEEVVDTPLSDQVDISFDNVDGWIEDDDQYRSIHIYPSMINGGNCYANSNTYIRTFIDYTGDETGFRLSALQTTFQGWGGMHFPVEFDSGDASVNWYWAWEYVWYPYDYDTPVPNSGGEPFSITIRYSIGGVSTNVRRIHFHLDEWAPRGDDDGSED